MLVGGRWRGEIDGFAGPHTARALERHVAHRAIVGAAPGEARAALDADLALIARTMVAQAEAAIVIETAPHRPPP